MGSLFSSTPKAQPLPPEPEPAPPPATLPDPDDPLLKERKKQKVASVQGGRQSTIAGDSETLG